MQNALNIVYEYCKDQKLTVNTDQIKIVIFSKGMCRRQQTYMFGKDNIEVADSHV